MVKRRDAARAAVVDEARTQAKAIEDSAAPAVRGRAAQKLREIDDEISGFEIAFDILVVKNLPAQRSVGECEAAIAAGIKEVIREETEPLLSRVHDLENGAACLRSELRALQYSGRWGLCPESLPARLAREPSNVFHADRPLSWDKQKVFDRQKAAWCDFADKLREDAGAMLNLGDD